MTTFFVDTSAVGRHYLPEVGSTWVLSWILPAFSHVIVLSEFLMSNFLLHVQQEYLVVWLDGTVVARARTLVTQYNLRTLDALQLAGA